MQEEVNQKSIAITSRSARLTGVALLRMIQSYIRHQKQKDVQRTIRPQGKISVKKLAKKGDTINSLDMNDKDIAMFNKIMRKYGVDYAVTKNTSKDNPSHTIFFKAKDADVLNKAFEKFTYQVTNIKPKRKSVLKELSNAKDLVASMVFKKVKTKNRER